MNLEDIFPKGMFKNKKDVEYVFELPDTFPEQESTADENISQSFLNYLEAYITPNIINREIILDCVVYEDVSNWDYCKEIARKRVKISLNVECIDE